MIGVIFFLKFTCCVHMLCSCVLLLSFMKNEFIFSFPSLSLPNICTPSLPNPCIAYSNAPLPGWLYFESPMNTRKHTFLVSARLHMI